MIIIINDVDVHHISPFILPWNQLAEMVKTVSRLALNMTTEQKGVWNTRDMQHGYFIASSHAHTRTHAHVAQAHIHTYTHTHTHART